MCTAWVELENKFGHMGMVLHYIFYGGITLTVVTQRQAPGNIADANDFFLIFFFLFCSDYNVIERERERENLVKGRLCSQVTRERSSRDKLRC